MVMGMAILIVIPIGIAIGVIFVALMEGWFRLFKSYPARTVKELRRQGKQIVLSKKRFLVIPATLVFVVMIYFVSFKETAQKLETAIKERRLEKKVILFSLELKGVDSPAKIKISELPQLGPGEKFAFEGPPETRVQFIGPSRFDKNLVVVAEEGNLKTFFGTIPKGVEEILFFGPSGEEVQIVKKPLEKPL